jgi:hypothetical protein
MLNSSLIPFGSMSSISATGRSVAGWMSEASECYVENALWFVVGSLHGARQVLDYRDVSN